MDFASVANSADRVAFNFAFDTTSSRLAALLTALGADETQIEASFCEAIRTAREQKSIPLARRAEASYAEYRSKK